MTSFFIQDQTRFGVRRRQRTALLALLLSVSACSAPAPKAGEIGAIGGFLGAAVVEEPRAALVARDVLSAGGTAADAVTAAFFTMTVTYPVAVGLGGGGVCLYYDHRSNKTETLDFRLAAAAAGGAIAVPGALRGMALLHSRYGRLPWGRLVAPAESLARFGHRISRALAKRLTPQAGRLKADASAAALFLHSDNTAPAEAENLIQVELASLLTRIRTRGVGDLYGGEAGQQFLRASTAQGGAVTISDLRQYRAVWRETDRRPIGNNVLHLPLLGPGDNLAYQLSGLLRNSAAEAGAQAFDQGDMDTAIDRGEAGIVVGDSFGSAAACVYQMNGAFGSAAMVPSLGIFLAPGSAARWRGYPLPLLGVNEHVHQTLLATVGAGGAVGAMAAAAVSLAVMAEGKSLAQAMAAPRPPTLGNMQVGSRVQGLWCSEGIRIRPDSCQFVSDPQAFGLASFDKF
ncbi:MAG: gamma-glutamyltransferase [Alphaproteobacteria bacterium]|nr:gamma-glutamyltransferase [Alphaproteobacteria bacterium]